MEDAEHYHQWSNLLLDEYNFSLDFEGQFPTTCCCVRDMHGIPGNHKPQWTRRVQRQCMPLSSCPHSGREPWLHKTMENQHFQAFLMPRNRGKLLTIEHTFRQPVSINRSMRTVAEFQPQVFETLLIQKTRQKTSRKNLDSYHYGWCPEKPKG